MSTPDKPERQMDWADHCRSLGPGLRYEDHANDPNRDPWPPSKIGHTVKQAVTRVTAWWRKVRS